MQLGGLAGMAGSPQPNAPAGGDVSGLLELLQQHPNLPSSFITGLLGAVGQASAAQQAKSAENRSGLQSLVTNATMQGASPQMIEGLANANYPNLAAKPFGQNLLTNLTSGILDPADNFDQEDKSILGQALVTQFGAKDIAPDDAETLYAMREQARQTAIAAGYSPAGVEQAVTFAEQVFSQLTGASPESANAMGRPGYSPSTTTVAGPAPSPMLASNPGGPQQGPLANSPLMTLLSKQSGYPT